MAAMKPQMTIVLEHRKGCSQSGELTIQEHLFHLCQVLAAPSIKEDSAITSILAPPEHGSSKALYTARLQCIPQIVLTRRIDDLPLNEWRTLYDGLCIWMATARSCFSAPFNGVLRELVVTCMLLFPIWFKIPDDDRIRFLIDALPSPTHVFLLAGCFWPVLSAPVLSMVYTTREHRNKYGYLYWKLFSTVGIHSNSMDDIVHHLPYAFLKMAYEKKRLSPITSYSVLAEVMEPKNTPYFGYDEDFSMKLCLLCSSIKPEAPDTHYPLYLDWVRTHISHWLHFCLLFPKHKHLLRHPFVYPTTPTRRFKPDTICRKWGVRVVNYIRLNLNLPDHDFLKTRDRGQNIMAYYAYLGLAKTSGNLLMLLLLKAEMAKSIPENSLLAMHFRALFRCLLLSSNPDKWTILRPVFCRSSRICIHALYEHLLILRATVMFMGDICALFGDE